MNVAKNLERSAFYFPQQPAVSGPSFEASYGQFNEQANRVATGLMKIGIEPGDAVGLCAPNSYEWLVFYFGVLKAGAVAVALSHLLKRDELKLLVEHSQPKIMFSMEEKLGELRDLGKAGILGKVVCRGGDLALEGLLGMGSPSFKAIDRERSDTAVILYTGGTTGVPKGVMLSHENINAAIHTVVFNERSTEKDRALCFLPFNHVFGQMHIMNATVLSGGCLEVMPAFDLEKVLEAMERGRVTKFYSVPTVYVRLLALDRLKERFGSVRYCFSAAASMAAEIVRQWKERTGLSIYEGYGMTEAAPTVTYNHHYRHVIGSVGTEVPGVEVQLRDESGNQVDEGREGEICVRGPNIMKGYLNNPEGTNEAFWDGGWFRSGDVGRFDEDGYLFIVDRIKDMIITGGENVYPKEVEDELYTRPEVQECAVIGLPDREWGEKVTAVIVLKPGEKVDQKSLKEFLREHLSSFKVPKEYRIVDELPKNPAGKILKRELRKQVIDS
ncbi:MAG: AMP-binding protein [Desulfobacterales bacterium]|nr:AMP-binding protein [Desulfobacterales bacterium]